MISIANNMIAVKSTSKKVVRMPKNDKILPNSPFIKEGVNLNTPVFDQSGKEVSSINLPTEIFGVKINTDLISQAIAAQMANARRSIAHSKDRSEVRGGGKKPWRQKGTGRARHASIRSPLWRGGGVTFGPRKERNFSVKINKKMKRQALLMVLSGKARDKELVILDDLKLEQAKTKIMAEMIKKINLGAKKDLFKGAMIVLSKKDELAERAIRNLPKILTMGVGSLNVVDLLSVKYLVMTKNAVERISEIYKTKNNLKCKFRNEK